MTGPGKRIVTGNDAEGRSRALQVDHPQKRGITAELWRSDTSAAVPDDGFARLLPPIGGSVFRFFRVMPEKSDFDLAPQERERLYAHHFAQMGAAHCRPDTKRHPGMHRTETLDYVMLLEGSVTLMLDDGDIDLLPFDVIVQRATNHAWVNRGVSPALLMAVLIDKPASS